MTTQEPPVYISVTDGDVYHSFEGCPSRFKTCRKEEVSLEKAEEQEYRSCEVCHVYVTNAPVNSFYHKKVCDSVDYEMTKIPLQRALDYEYRRL